MVYDKMIKKSEKYDSLNHSTMCTAGAGEASFLGSPRDGEIQFSPANTNADEPPMMIKSAAVMLRLVQHNFSIDVVGICEGGKT